MSRRYEPYNPSYSVRHNNSDRGPRGKDDDRLRSQDSRYSSTDYSRLMNPECVPKNSVAMNPSEVRSQRAPDPGSPSYYLQNATSTNTRNYSLQESAAPRASIEHFPYTAHSQPPQPESKYSDDAMYISKAKEMALKTQQMLSKFSGAKNSSESIQAANFHQSDAQLSNVMAAERDGERRHQMSVDNVNQLLYGNNYVSIPQNTDASRSYDNSGSMTAGEYTNTSQSTIRQSYSQSKDEPDYFQNQQADQHKESTRDVHPNLGKAHRFKNETQQLAPAAPSDNPNYDPTIENILKSIGFNFEFSHMKQAEARERQRQLDLAAAEEAEKAKRAAVDEARLVAAEDARRLAAEEVRRAAIEEARQAAAEESRRTEAQNIWDKGNETARLAAIEESRYLASTQLLHDRMLNPSKYRRTPDSRTDLYDASRSSDHRNREPQAKAAVKEFYEDFSDSDNDFRGRTPSPSKAKKMKTDFPETKSVESHSSSNRPESSRDISKENVSDWEAEKNYRRSTDRKSRNKDFTRTPRSNSKRQGLSKDTSSSERSSERCERLTSSRSTKIKTTVKKYNRKSNHRSNSSNERSSERDRSKEKERCRSSDRRKHKYSLPAAYSKKSDCINKAPVTDNKGLKAGKESLKKVPIVIVSDDEAQEESGKKYQRLQHELASLKEENIQLRIRLRRWSRDDGQSGFDQNKILLERNEDHQSKIHQQMELLNKKRKLIPDNLSRLESSPFTKKMKKSERELGNLAGSREELIRIDKTTTSLQRSTEGGDKNKLKKMTVNYLYEDKGDHWCKSCNHISTTIQFHLEHLHSLEHSKHIKKRTWPSLLAKTNDKPNAVAAPIQGVEFIMATQSFYCSLCEEFSSDEVLAEAHLKTDSHNQKFQRFVDDNPQYERTYNLEKAGRVCIKPDPVKPDVIKDVKLAAKTVEHKKLQESTSEISLDMIQLPAATQPSQQPVLTTQGRGTASLPKPVVGTTTATVNTSVHTATVNTSSAVSITTAPSIENASSVNAAPLVINRPPTVKKTLPFIGKLPNYRRVVQTRKNSIEAPLSLVQQSSVPPLPSVQIAKNIGGRRRSSSELDKLVALASVDAAASVKVQTATFVLENAARNSPTFDIPSSGVSEGSGSQWSSQDVSSSYFKDFGATSDNIGAHLVSNSNDSLDSFLSIGDSSTSGHKSLPWFSELTATANLDIINLPLDPLSVAKNRKLPRQFSSSIDQPSNKSNQIQSPLDTPISADFEIKTSISVCKTHPKVTLVKAVRSRVATCQNMPPEMRKNYINSEEKTTLNSVTVSPAIEDAVDKVGQETVSDDCKVDAVIPTSSNSIQNATETEVKSDLLINNTLNDVLPDNLLADNQTNTNGKGETGDKIPPVSINVGTEILSSLNNTAKLADIVDAVVEDKDLTIFHTDTCLPEQNLHADQEMLKDGEDFRQALFEAKRKSLASIAEIMALRSTDNVVADNALPSLSQRVMCSKSNALQTHNLPNSCISDVMNEDAETSSKEESLNIDIRDEVNSIKNESLIRLDTFNSLVVTEKSLCEVNEQVILDECNEDVHKSSSIQPETVDNFQTSEVAHLKIDEVGTIDQEFVLPEMCNDSEVNRFSSDAASASTQACQLLRSQIIPESKDRSRNVECTASDKVETSKVPVSIVDSLLSSVHTTIGDVVSTADVILSNEIATNPSQITNQDFIIAPTDKPDELSSIDVSTGASPENIRNCIDKGLVNTTMSENESSLLMLKTVQREIEVITASRNAMTDLVKIEMVNINQNILEKSTESNEAINTFGQLFSTVVPDKHEIEDAVDLTVEQVYGTSSNSNSTLDIPAPSQVAEIDRKEDGKIDPPIINTSKLTVEDIQEANDIATEKEFANNLNDAGTSSIRSSFEIGESWSLTELSSTVPPACEVERLDVVESIETNTVSDVEKDIVNESRSSPTGTTVKLVITSRDINESKVQTSDSDKTELDVESDCFITFSTPPEDEEENERVTINQTVIGDNVLVYENKKPSCERDCLEPNSSGIFFLPMTTAADTTVAKSVHDSLSSAMSVVAETESEVEHPLVLQSTIIDVDSD